MLQIIQLERNDEFLLDEPLEAGIESQHILVLIQALLMYAVCGFVEFYVTIKSVSGILAIACNHVLCCLFIILQRMTPILILQRRVIYKNMRNCYLYKNSCRAFTGKTATVKTITLGVYGDMELGEILMGLFYGSQNYINCTMETYKKGSQSEIQTIEHIKFIAQGLFKDSEPEKYSEFTYHGKGKGKQREASSNEFAPSVMYRQEMEMQYESPKDHAKKGQRELPSTLPSKKSISRKRPIFSNFDEFWVKCSQSPERKATTPLIDRINKSIYSQFKTESRVTHDLTDNVLNSSEKQALWTDFLQRDEQWNKERTKQLREKQLKEISSQSPELRKRIKTASNFNHHQSLAQREMSEVEKSILKLRLQTEKLRLKILNIDSGERSPSRQPLSKTYKAR